MKTFLIIGLIGAIILAISVFVYSQFMTPRKPPKWTYLGIILGVIFIFIAIFLAFYPPIQDVPVPLPLPLVPVPLVPVPVRPVPVIPVPARPIPVPRYPEVRNVAVIPPPVVIPVALPKSGFETLRP